MKLLIIATALLILTGCSALSQIFEAGAEASDKALIASEAVICRGASIGSVIRRYDTEEKAKAWKELCTNNSEAVPIILDNN